MAVGLPVLGQGDGAGRWGWGRGLGQLGEKGTARLAGGGCARAMFPAAVPIPVPIPTPCSTQSKEHQQWGHRMGLTSFCFVLKRAFCSSASRDLGPTGSGLCFT